MANRWPACCAPASTPARCPSSSPAFAAPVGVGLPSPAIAPTPATLFFEQRGGWILAGLEHPGWMSHATGERAGLLSAALLGLYKFAAVDLVQEQIEAAFAPRPVAFEL